MDKAKAIQTFLDTLDTLTRLPLITDKEMVGLYGEEMMNLLGELDRRGREQRFCDDCQSRCCLAVRCELYTPQFQQCPIHDFRPPICRLHYCHRFFPDDDTYLRELSDVFFDCLLTADRYGSKNLTYFDTPPLSRHAGRLVEATAEWVNAVKDGSLSPGKALCHIRAEAEKYRIATTG